MEGLRHKEKPSETDILRRMVQAWATVAPSLPLSQLSRDTLASVCLWSAAQEVHRVPQHQLPWSVLSSSARKEGVASRGSGEGLGAVSGHEPPPPWEEDRNTVGVRAVRWQNGALVGRHPPGRVQSQRLWLLGELLGALLGEPRPLASIWTQPGGLERWESHAPSTHPRDSGKAQTLCTRLQGNREGRKSSTTFTSAAPGRTVSPQRV